MALMDLLLVVVVPIHALRHTTIRPRAGAGSIGDPELDPCICGTGSLGPEEGAQSQSVGDSIDRSKFRQQMRDEERY